jgi:hypothetical protein
MPFWEDEWFAGFRESLGVVQLFYAQTVRFTEFDAIGNDEDRFAATVADLVVNGQMVIVIGKETIAVWFEDCRYKCG